MPYLICLPTSQPNLIYLVNAGISLKNTHAKAAPTTRNLKYLQKINKTIPSEPTFSKIGN